MSEQNSYAYGYARMPRIIRKGYKEITHQQKLLYIYLRDLCGENTDEGTCYRSLRSLAKETGFSTGFLCKAIPVLHNANLIHAEMKKRQGTDGEQTEWEVWHITIADIWEKNARYLQSLKEKCSPDEHNSADSLLSVHQMNESVHEMNTIPEKCSPDEQKCSRGDTLLRKKKENPITRESENENEVQDAHASEPIPILVQTENDSHLSPEKPKPTRKPKPSPSKEMEMKIEAVFVCAEKAIGRLTKIDDFTYARTRKDKEAIREMLQGRQVTPQSLTQVIDTLYNTPRDERSGFDWKDNMTIGAICRNYDKTLIRCKRVSPSPSASEPQVNGKINWSKKFALEDQLRQAAETIGRKA